MVLRQVKAYKYFLFSLFLLSLGYPPKLNAQSSVDSLEIYNPFTHVNDIRRIIKTYFTILGDNNTALIEEYNKQLEEARRNNLFEKEVEALIKSGDIYFNSSLYNIALDKYFLALSKYESVNDSVNAALIQLKIGRTYYYSDLEPAREYIPKAYEVLKDSKNKELAAFAYYAYAVIEVDTTKSNLFFQKALDTQLEVIKEKPNDYTANENLSRYLNSIGKLDAALALAKKIGSNWLQVLYLNNMGFRLVREGKYKDALDIFFKSVGLCKEDKIMTLLRNTYENIARAYRLSGKSDLALKYFQLMQFVQESLYTERFTINLSESRVKYDTEKKELENEYLRKEKAILADNISIEKSLNLLLIISITFISVISFYIYLSRKKLRAANLLLDEQNNEILFQKRELENLNNELKQSERNLKVAQSTAHLANWEWNSKNDEFTFSEELPKLYEVDEDELKQNFIQTVLNIIHPDDKPGFENYFYGDINSINNGEKDYKVTGANKIRWMRTKRIAVKDKEGNVIKIFGIVQDITNIKEEEEIKIRMAAQQSFTEQLIDSQEEERKRIAAELHDSIGQVVLLIKNRALLGLQSGNLNNDAEEQFSKISDSASSMLNLVREISFNLRAPSRATGKK